MLCKGSNYEVKSKIFLRFEGSLDFRWAITSVNHLRFPWHLTVLAVSR